MNHLQQLAPDILGMLESASDSKLRMACVEVCQYAAARNSPLEPIVDEGLSVLRSGSGFEKNLVEGLEVEMNLLDDQYFSLKDQAEDEGDEDKRNCLIRQSQEYFRKARAVAALWSSANANRFAATAEAIYEAAASVSDEADLFDLMKRVLKS